MHMKANPVLVRNVLGLVVFFGTWQLLSVFGLINDYLLPSPLQVIQALWVMLLDGTLLTNLGASLLRVGVGYCLALVVGLSLGFLCGWFRVFSDLVRPVVEVIRPIPPLAWVPIAILWFGLGDASAYFLVFLGCVFPAFFGAYTAVRAIDRNQLNAALCLGAGRWLLLRDVLIPASLPIVMPNMRLALGIGWMCVVTAELIAAQTGLGYLIQQSRMVFQIQNVVAGMATIGFVGFLMSNVLERIERRLIAWAPSERV